MTHPTAQLVRKWGSLFEKEKTAAFAGVSCTHLPIWAWSGWLFCSFRWPARWNLFPAAKCPCNTTSHSIHSVHATNDLATAERRLLSLRLVLFASRKASLSRAAAITLDSNRTRWPSNFGDYSLSYTKKVIYGSSTCKSLLLSYFFMGLLNRQKFIETLKGIKDSFFARATQHVH